MLKAYNIPETVIVGDALGTISPELVMTAPEVYPLKVIWLNCPAVSPEEDAPTNILPDVPAPEAPVVPVHPVMESVVPPVQEVE